MKNKLRKFISFALAMSCASSIVVLSSCDNNKEDTVERNTALRVFESSDGALDNFLNSYMERHIGYNDNRVITNTLGTGTTYAKYWEERSLSWFDHDIIGKDIEESIKTQLEVTPQDDYGMIFNANNNFLDSMWSGVAGGNPFGWPFPLYNKSQGNSIGWEFNNSANEDWYVQSGEEISYNGYLNVAFAGGKDEALILKTKDFPLLYDKTYSTEHCPIIELDMRLNNLHLFGMDSDVEEVYVIWKTENGGETWYEVPLSTWAVTNPEQTAYTASRTWLPMYLNENWNGQNLTAVGVKVQPKDGKALDIEFRLNYFQLNYDTRQSFPTSQYIMAFAEYASTSRDLEFLQNNLAKLRQAIMWELECLKGKQGMLDISYLQGHDGIPNKVGHGISDCYYDITPSPAINFWSNVNFYGALKAVIGVEKMAAAYGITDTTANIRHPYNMDERIQWTYSVTDLETILSDLKTNIEKPYVDGDYDWSEKGGFWDAKTGRFIQGITAEGNKLDYGYLHYNLEAISYGIGTDAQVKSIMDWIDGDRIVEGDTSTGDDIYIFEFAPRYSTVDNKKDYLWAYQKGGEGRLRFGDSVNDGGAVITWSYHDLVARVQERGVEDAFGRLKEINAWYDKVASYGGEGINFYREYYDRQDVVTVQGSGNEGGAGLDSEFLEASLMYAAIPYGFFGFDATEADIIGFTHNLPEKLTYWQMNHMEVGSLKFSVKMTKNSFTILNAKGVVGDMKLKLTFDKPSGSEQVLIDGKATTDYVVNNDKIIVTIPFANCTVTVK